MARSLFFACGGVWAGPFKASAAAKSAEQTGAAFNCGPPCVEGQRSSQDRGADGRGLQLRATVCCRILSTGISAGNSRLKKPTIISAQLSAPQVTSLLGSALSGLFGELSKCAVHSMRVPSGSTMGAARLYQSCQCQL